MSSRRSERFQERFNVWPGFTDVMVGLLLVFVTVVTLFTITETILSRSLSKKDTELQRLHSEISRKTEELSRLHRLITEKTRDMERLTDELSDRAAEMKSLRDDVDLKASELERMRSELTRLEMLFGAEVDKSVKLGELLSQREDRLKAASAELEDKTGRLDEKERLAKGLQAELQAAMLEIGSKIAQIRDRDRALGGEKERIEAALARIAQLSALLEDREKKAGELGLRLGETEKDLARTRTELSEKQARAQDLSASVQALNARISELTSKIAKYVDEVAGLNRLLAEARRSEDSERTRAAALQREISSMTERLKEISGKLAHAEEEKDKQFRLAQLVDLLGQKDKEIERLRDLARYRSEFLARLAQVFQGVSDIRVQGDRFVFQSEILFASGRANLNDSGAIALDKFIRIYKEMAPKIPKDLPLLVLVEGHTDVDPIRSALYKSNWELSSARAMAVVRYMIDKGIPPERLGASALGEFHPIADGDSPEAKRLNRRIEIKITSL